MLPWTSMGYSMEFHGYVKSPNKKSPSSMGFHGIRRAPFQMTQVFHAFPLNIQWDSMEIWCRQMTHHLVPWNSVELWDFHFINTMLLWTFMGYSMEFHGTLRLSLYSIPRSFSWTSMEYSMELHGVSWESMELGGRHFKWHKCSVEFHAIFHGILWNSGAAKWNIA